MLSEFVVGQSGVVKQLNNSRTVKSRLNELGVIEGVKIELVRKAPFGDPFQVKIRDFYLAIRKTEASMIEMEKI